MYIHNMHILTSESEDVSLCLADCQDNGTVSLGARPLHTEKEGLVNLHT